MKKQKSLPKKIVPPRSSGKADFTCLSSSKESEEIDRTARAKYGLSAEALMESAGALSAREITAILNEMGFSAQPPCVLVLCGPGNNGGDGLVVARHLLSEGIPVKVVLSSATRGSALVEKQKARLASAGAKIQVLKNTHQIERIFDTKCVLVVDALFGVGLARKVEGVYAKLIQWMNTAGRKVVSLDVPSGLNVDTGSEMGCAVRADFTFTFGLAKPGFYLMRGPLHTGKLKVLPIGFPRPLLREKACTRFLIDWPWVSSRLPARDITDHKARQGHLLIMAGSRGMWGAGVLTALSAYRMGVGYVTWARADDSKPLKANIPDVLTQSLSDSHLFKGKTTAVIGPGLGLGQKVKDLLLDLTKLNIPVVVDADAFTVCVREKLFPLPARWVVTPHSGELARLFNVTGGQVDTDRCDYALKAEQKIGCPVLLKGVHSVLAYKGRCYIIPTGNSALAKAGTGDVLTGFIGALMARSLDAFTAGAIASFVHGQIAEKWVEGGRDKDSLMAQDLKEILPVVLKDLRQGILRRW